MKLCRLLTWLLPESFRREFRDEILATIEEQRREASPTLGRGELARFWGRQWLGIVRAAVRLRWGRGILGGADRKRQPDLTQGAKRSAGKPGWDLLWKDVRQSTRSLGVASRVHRGGDADPWTGHRDVHDDVQRAPDHLAQAASVRRA